MKHIQHNYEYKMHHRSFKIEVFTVYKQFGRIYNINLYLSVIERHCYNNKTFLL